MLSSRRRFLLIQVLILKFTLSQYILMGQSQYVYNHLVWRDEFNNKSNNVDTTKWNIEIGNGCPSLCGWGNNELEYYSKNSDNVKTEGGMLIIQAQKQDLEEFKYSSAKLTTKYKADWKYGRFEIRAKIPFGRGVWPAIWMLPTTSAYGQWPHSGEIDIMENVGYMPDSLFGTVHTGAYNGMKGTQKSGSFFSKKMSAEFHNYSVEWTNEMITFYIDNIKYHTFKNTTTDSEAWPFDQKFHLILNLAIGGNWGGKFGVDDSIFPQKMLVDYVRVYQ